MEVTVQQLHVIVFLQAADILVGLLLHKLASLHIQDLVSFDKVTKCRILIQQYSLNMKLRALRGPVPGNTHLQLPINSSREKSF